ncbi:MAG: galactokinase [Chlamydiales bacterium]|jgi:galactokinase
MEFDGVQTPAARAPIPEQLQAHGRLFEARFGPAGGSQSTQGGAAEAPRLFFAPGRVNLFGAHLDYNGGPVMPTAIDRGTFFAVRPRSDSRVVVASTLSDDDLDVDLKDLPDSKRDRWYDYTLGVLLDVVGQSGNGHGGLDVLLGGNLAIGAGLSSSASICVGTALMLDTVWGLGLGGMQHVDIALRAEREFVGVQCGIMDPFAVGLAKPQHLLWLDCKDRSWVHLPLDFSRVSIGVADTGVRRKLAQGEFNTRVAQCATAFEGLRITDPGAECLRDISIEHFESHRGELDPTVALRAEHVVYEVRRAFEARAALERGDLDTMGSLMTQAHESMRDLYEVSCVELDELVNAAVDGEGVYGSRLTGAGFGGCTVMLIRRGDERSVCERVSRRFEARFGRTPAIEIYGGDHGPREIEI